MSSTKCNIRVVCAFAALATLALAASCRGFFVSPTIASFVISPTSPTVPLNGETQMHAFGTDTNGNPTGDITSKITWSSLNPGVVTVDASGLLKGVTLDTTTPVEIDATYQALTKQSANATVCVDTIVSGSFTIVPSNTNIPTNTAFPNGGGMTATVDATVSGATETLDITAGVQWSSSSTNLTIANGTNPATVTLTPVTTNTTVTVTANYTCNTTTFTQTTKLTLTPQ